ncbi:MAG TPA: hypothetical protein VJT67_17915 [Longimicrobiaceae bacterium]|nr:hypothetical protein [Longimicrobiaceae bacterium]
MTLDSLIASPVTGLLALVGAVAIVYRLARGLLRLGLAAAETGAAGAMVQASIRHGDLTGMAERRAQVSTVRRTRTLAALEVLLWLALLAVPPMAGFSRPVYAIAALVWLLPRTRIRLTAVARRPEP